jgi:NADPH:quinone reductase-like Zn-dependent oxidoreductase
MRAVGYQKCLPIDNPDALVDLELPKPEPSFAAPGLVLSTTHTGAHLPAIAALIAPQGRFALIDDAPVFDINPFKRKSVSAHWEFMFTRSMFATADIAEQGKLLKEVARLVDAGTLRTTLGESFGRINAGNLSRAHALIESGRAKGKIVLEGFGD